ncbi:esterase OVCA2 [Pelobates cultripes]|uniref:Esterase OVCA2 n=1 Tax=Pelobates cultripes TaxID=61616 RepID=A0AAD1QY58_PELCU|nr:esterase OVCA2 [Pelobates cultripes]
MAAPSASARPVLRLLALHGYRQNERSFREKTGALRKILKGRAEIVHITAPLIIPEPGGDVIKDGNSDSSEEEPRGWWFSNPEDNSFNAMDNTEGCSGLDDSFQTVAKAFTELGPFNGILGFSQGAALVAMLCSLMQRGDVRFKFDFAVLVAGFKSRASEHEEYYQQPITVPSLHVYGETDRVIPDHMSQELVLHFEKPVTLTHAGGHFVPASAQQKKVYLEFLNMFNKCV